MDNNLNQTPSGLKALNLLGIVLIVLAFFILGDYFALFIISKVYGIQLSGIEALINSPEPNDKTQHLLLKLQGVKALFSFLIFPILYILFFKKYLKDYINIQTSYFLLFLLLAPLTLFILMPFIGFLVHVNKSFHLPEALKHIEEWMLKTEKQNEALTKMMVFYDNRQEFILIFLVVAILPAIGEELLFRGILQNELMISFKNPHVGIWLASIIFSALHFQFFGFLPRLALGVLFGYMYYWSGNFLVPVFLHFLNNGLTFIMMNLYQRKAIDFDIDNTQTLSPSGIIISILLSSLILFQCYRLYKARILRDKKIV